jgi:uncharacterized membrane protein YgcG
MVFARIRLWWRARKARKASRYHYESNPNPKPRPEHYAGMSDAPSVPLIQPPPFLGESDRCVLVRTEPSACALGFNAGPHHALHSDSANCSVGSDDSGSSSSSSYDSGSSSDSGGSCGGGGE